MNRTIVLPSTEAPTRREGEPDQGAPLPPTTSPKGVPGKGDYDSYFARVFKLVPAEVVSLYVTLTALAPSIVAKGNPKYVPLTWLIFVIGLAGTPFQLVRIAMVKSPSQIAVATLAYVAWVLALGGPFETIGISRSVGAFLLPIFTFVLPGLPIGVPANDPRILSSQK